MKKLTKDRLIEILDKNTAVLSIVALLFAILLSGIIMALSGYNPFEAFAAIIEGAFLSQSAIAQTLTQATPLIFTGLAFTFAKRATIMNLGIEGQLYLGAMAAAIVGPMDLGLPIFIHLPLALLAGIIAGSLYAGLVGVLKVKFGSNEVIATIMLNSIAIYFVGYLVNDVFLAEGSSTAQTEKVLDTALLPKIFSKYQLTIAIIFAILACILVKWIFDRTVLGYEITGVGLNPLAAQTAGISVNKVVIISLLISGAIAGFAGASHVLGVDKRLIVGFSPGYGFDGIAVSALASGSPIGVIFSGIIFGALRAGSMFLNRTTSTPTEFVGVIQALVVIFVAAPMLMKQILLIDKAKASATAKEVKEG